MVRVLPSAALSVVSSEITSDGAKRNVAPTFQDAMVLGSVH
jgi:hypothetical protein